MKKFSLKWIVAFCFAAFLTMSVCSAEVVKETEDDGFVYFCTTEKEMKGVIKGYSIYDFVEHAEDFSLTKAEAKKRIDLGYNSLIAIFRSHFNYDIPPKCEYIILISNEQQDLTESIKFYGELIDRNDATFYFLTK